MRAERAGAGTDRQIDRRTDRGKQALQENNACLFFFKKGDFGGLNRCITVKKTNKQKQTCKLHKLKFNSDLSAVLFLHLETNTHLGPTTQAAALTF